MNSTIFKTTTRNEFEFLKNPKNESHLLASLIPLQEDGYLVPLSHLHLKNNEIINKLWNWREDNAFAYPSRYETSFESTKAWIKKALLENPDRILFLVYDKIDNLIGHAGFNDASNDECELEFDNIVRGDENARRGIMTDVMNTLKRWAETTVFPNNFYLRVLASNDHAIEFYKKMGYQETSRYGLKKEVAENGYRLISSDSNEEAVDHFVVMKPQPSLNNGEKMILTAGPSIGTREKVYSLDAAANGWNSQWSKYLGKFEKEFSDYVGTKYTLATSSCTGAMHIALMALGIGEGDEVIVPDITWVSTANAVRFVGGTPVFADIDPKTWKIDPKSIESLISKKTKAIMPVHLYGNPCDMDQIMKIAGDNNLYVLEDAAPSIGAEYKGKRTGSFGHFSAFSFQGAKLAVTGEGGMLCTNDEELYKKAYRIWDQGRIPGTFWIEELGLKYKMSNIQAALGLGQILRNDAMVEAKRRINKWYKQRLESVEEIDFWEESEGTRSIYWMTCIALNEKAKISREDFCTKLKDVNVDTRPVFPSISQYPYWPKKQPAQPNAQKVSISAINLPSGVGLLEGDIDYVCKKIIELLNS